MKYIISKEMKVRRIIYIYIYIYLRDIISHYIKKSNDEEECFISRFYVIATSRFVIDSVTYAGFRVISYFHEDN